VSDKIRPATPASPPSAALRWTLLGVRVLGIAAGAAVLGRIPLPLLDEWLPVKNVVIAVAAVALMGKCLYDTLFYDRFWP
jgi:hypothetical protein